MTGNLRRHSSLNANPFLASGITEAKNEKCSHRKQMRKEQRLRKSKDFAAVRRERKSRSDSLLVLLVRPNNLEVTRFGFSVGKRVGKAVVRNKVKRRLREAARLTKVQNGWDLVLIARKDASSADYHVLKQSMTQLFKRAGVLDSSAQ